MLELMLCLIEYAAVCGFAPPQKELKKIHFFFWFWENLSRLVRESKKKKNLA